MICDCLRLTKRFNCELPQLWGITIICGGHDARGVVSEHEQTEEFLVLNSWLSISCSPDGYSQYLLLTALSILFTLAARILCMHSYPIICYTAMLSLLTRI
jgi:hypothetical protein